MSKSLVVKNILSTNEVGKFVDAIASIELKDYCEIKIDFSCPQCAGRALCTVELTTKTEDGEYFLRASLKDGMLRHWGWAGKLPLPEHAV